MILYECATHRAHCLGAVAHAVWRSWDAGASASEIAGRVEAETGQPIEPVALEVALRRLGRAGLVARPSRARCVEGRGGPSAPGRRQALRRVATLAGLAVASLSVPAPEAAAATCSRQPGQSCQHSSECCPASSGTPYCCGQLLRLCLPSSVANCAP